MPVLEFWKAVYRDTSVEVSLDSYLQFRRRWYDFHAEERGKALGGVIVGDDDLFRRVFMVLFRMSLKSESKAQELSDSSLSQATFQRRFFDIPKLLDICAIYGHENPHLTRQLVSAKIETCSLCRLNRTNICKVENVFTINEELFKDLGMVVPVISNIVQTMEQRCLSTLFQMQTPREPSRMSVNERILQELLEAANYLYDSILSLYAFVDVFWQGAVALVVSRSDSSHNILFVLERIHDSLVPAICNCFSSLHSQSTNVDKRSTLEGTAKRLRSGLIDLVWRLFSFSFLKEDSFADVKYSYVNDLLGMYVCDPQARGEKLVQTLSGMVEISSASFAEEMVSTGALIRNVDRKHNLLQKIRRLQQDGLMFLDAVQYEYIDAIVAHATIVSSASLSDQSNLFSSGQGVSESDILNESKISHIKDILPDYGAGFIAACLEAYDNNPEEVIQRILEGKLHPSLQSMDKTLEMMPTGNIHSVVKDKGKAKVGTDDTYASLQVKDKGKGKVDEGSSHEKTQQLGWQTPMNGSTSFLPMSEVSFPKALNSDANKDLQGRYVRKSKGEENLQGFLDEGRADIRMRTSDYVSQYEDEYDDSFDELGTSITDGLEETENLVDLIRSKAPVQGDRRFAHDSTVKGGDKNGWMSRGSVVHNKNMHDAKNILRSGNDNAVIGTRTGRETSRGFVANNNFMHDAVNILRSDNNNAVNDTRRTGPQTSSRGRGKGKWKERGQFYVKDGMNYSYKVAGSVAVAGVEEAEALKKKERETIHGLGEGGNVPLTAEQTAQGPHHAHTRAAQSGHSLGHGTDSRGRGSFKKDRDHHHRKDRAMRKHFSGLGGI
ncbi:hypothetical protein KP509_03G087200 [Ceratopteris richardii]|uniref:CUE domain-containing protein n=1 Tax=Ceratopteris richardii TaxID=49495 RepID=A0A8T2V4S3_CERRI|nr:hypothetical protein KP509_03G087200 [Ceratopteris richardii]